MKSLFEEMGGTYRQVGDYFIPNLVLLDTGDYQIGKYGRMRRSYLKEHRKILYTSYVMEGALQKLSEQEAKYSAELDEALKQYAELKEQAAGMDAAELMDARFAVREEKERSAVDRVKSAYGEKYDSMMMHDSKRDVANLLHEEAETRSVRERLRQKQQQQAQQRQKKSKHHEREK